MEHSLGRMIVFLGAIGVVCGAIFFSTQSTAPKASPPTPSFNPSEFRVEESDASLPRTRQTFGKSFFTIATHSAEKAFQGFTLLPVSGAEEIFLIAMNGDIVHRWPADAMRAKLLPNCNMMVIHGSKFGQERGQWDALTDRVRELDWDSNIDWGLQVTDGKIHHDLERTDSGSTLLLRGYDLHVSGKIPRSLNEGKPFTLISDSILEVDLHGKVLWEWLAHDHFAFDHCGWKGCTENWPAPRGQREYRDWTHLNTVSALPDNKWHKAGDTRFRPGNILTIPRNFWTVFLIDKETGKITWKYEGEHGGSAVDVQNGIVRGHEAHMIPEGLPGAGNILVYDNGLANFRPHSIIREINPTTNEIVWKYEDGPNFFGSGAGSVQRLPNGNTFISVDRGKGRVFEVTPEGEVVWDLRLKYLYLPARASRYAPNFCPRLEALPQS